MTVALPPTRLPTWAATLLEEAQTRRNGGPPFTAPETIPEGQRNDLLFKLGCSLRSRGLEAEEIEATLLAANRKRCNPPLEESEVHATAENVVARYDAGDLPDGADEESPLAALNRIVEGDVKFTAEWRQVGRHRPSFYGCVCNKQTGEPVEIGPFSERQVRTMAELSDAIWVAGGGELVARTRSHENYHKFYRALRAATKIEELGVTEAGIWRGRLARYLDGRLGAVRDPEDADHRVLILEGGTNAEPFCDPQGRVLVNVPSLAEFFSHGRTVFGDPEIAAALKRLGFDRVSVQQRIGGSNRHRTYWRSPLDFDWRSEA
jgi:hypothetical protein